MGQNLAAVHPTQEQWAAVDAGMDTVEQTLDAALVSLSRDDRQRLTKMGDGSEPFCRKALDVMSQNTQILPRDFDVTEMRRDLESHDALNARLVRMTRMMERMRDTEMALGSDVMVAALEGYAFLKIAGKSEGLHALRRALGKRFDGNGKRSDPPPVAPVAEDAEPVMA